MQVGERLNGHMACTLQSNGHTFIRLDPAMRLTHLALALPRSLKT